MKTKINPFFSTRGKLRLVRQAVSRKADWACPIGSDDASAHRRSAGVHRVRLVMRRPFRWKPKLSMDGCHGSKPPTHESLRAFRDVSFGKHFSCSVATPRSDLGIGGALLPTHPSGGIGLPIRKAASVAIQIGPMPSGDGAYQPFSDGPKDRGRAVNCFGSSQLRAD